ncbi:MAG: hypothetical protein IT337_08030, partial [Thermomicrobiales bacterium]|nr:hypothetical protein [Thermomicrobiales bacterium]
LTRSGEPWASQGVDVYRVDGEQIVEFAVYSDTARMQRQLDPYGGAGELA